MKYFLILFTFLISINAFPAGGQGGIQADRIYPSVSGNPVNISKVKLDNLNLDASWITSTNYVVNDIVFQSNKIYKCVTAHTSGVFATDLAAGKWIEESQGITDHTLLSNIGTNTHAQIDSHIANTSNPHAVTAAQVGLGLVNNTSDATKNSAAATLTNKILQEFVTTEQIDSTTTGSLATVPSSTSSLIKLTNASLVSITGITAGTNNKFLVLVNATGTVYTVKNSSGTSANQIITGTAADITMADGSSLLLVYPSSISKWIVVGGTGSGSGGGLSAWVTAKGYSANDVVIQNNKIYKALLNHTSGTFATDLANGDWVEISAMDGVDLSTNQTVGGTKTFSSTIVGSISGNAATVTTNANLTGEATSSGNAVTLTNSAVIGKVLTGYTSGSGTVSASDSILGAIQKLNGNVSAITSFSNLTGAVTSVGAATSLGSFTSANLATALTDETGTLKTVFSDSPTFTTQITAPVLIGGTGTTSSLIFKTTTGVGATGADHIFQVGSNGATEAMRIQNNGNVGIGTSPNANAILDVSSTTKALLPPRMTTTQKLAIGSPTAGMEVYDTTLGKPSYYDGTVWQAGLGTVSVDTEWTACTFSTLAWQGVGTVTNTSLQCRRTGPNLEMKGTVTLGTMAAALIQIPLPSNYGTIVTQSPGSAESYGTLLRNVSGSSAILNAISTVGLGYFQVSNTMATANNPATPANANAVFGNNEVIEFQNIKIPISGWLSNSSTYSGAGAGVDPTSYTPTLANLGTTSPTTNQCKYEIFGGNMTVRCFFTAGTVSGGVSSISLPSGFTIDTTKLISTATTTGPTQAVGTWSNNGANLFGQMLVFPGTSSTLIYFGAGTTSTGILAAQSASPYPTSSVAVTLEFKVPLVGKSNVSQVVANISGYTQAPGVAGSATPNVDHISVSYGTTNATTVCSTSPCSYLDQIGTGATSVTRSATGSYTLNTVRTYSKLKCIINARGPTNYYFQPDPISCSSCSSGSFTTSVTSGGALNDTFGIIMCDGVY